MSIDSKLVCCSKELEDVSCCGCSACMQVCPVNAISMRFEIGAYRPIIEYNRCISCGHCLRICQAYSSEPEKTRDISLANCYVAVAHDKSILDRSSSGGVGYIIGRYAIENGLPYCGAKYSSARERCEHLVCNRVEDLKSTQGSKYLQSACGPAFSELIAAEKGIAVGTPCQVAGLDRVLRERGIRESYILVDIFCHGVPNQMVWDNHLKWLKNRKKIIDNEVATFRNKKDYILTLGKYRAWYNEDAFFTLFLRGMLYNRPCYSCRYRRRSYADIRIGDLMVKKYMHLPYSPSCILVLTESGKELLQKVSDNFEIFDESYSTIDGIQESTSCPMPSNYGELFNSLVEGVAPEDLIKTDIIYGRFKSFIKHVLLGQLLDKFSIHSDDLKAYIDVAQVVDLNSEDKSKL